jgi:hypothetical protein
VTVCDGCERHIGYSDDNVVTAVTPAWNVTSVTVVTCDSGDSLITLITLTTRYSCDNLSGRPELLAA